MPIRSLGDKVPRIAPTAWVSEMAYVVGDVEIGEGSSIWPGAVVRGDFGSITIGRDTHIEDNCVVHSAEHLTIGDHVIVGHGVVVHCLSVGSNCLLGNNATLLDGAVIGDECLIAAGSVVLGRTEVPQGSFVSGAPASVEPVSDRHLRRLRSQAQAGDKGYGGMAQRYRSAGL